MCYYLHTGGAVLSEKTDKWVWEYYEAEKEDKLNSITEDKLNKKVSHGV